MADSPSQKIKDRKKSILITGAHGQLGSTFQNLSKNYGDLHFIFCSSKKLDVTHKESVQEIFKEFNPDFCINCAAYTNVEQAEKEPDQAFKINAEGVKNLAEICKEYQTTLIHISTDYVFDGKKRRPYSVDDLPNPINQYGKSKLKGEQYIQDILTEYVIVRTSWLYSKEFGNNFYKTILRKAKTEKELFITDAQTGCPTDTVNLATKILSKIEENTEDYGVFHFCDREEMTWYGFSKQILTENDLREIKVIKDNTYKTIAERPIYSVLEVNF
ncbi:dTDP-4-dehydrorhamnose reductase [Galbibacter sp. BG1]|uniref:dTDP-4-dehydrorhamnose reductase n=1 Tax=Galbibacter sp. BG1 TaxID=1170699 RepID=UPI0015BE8C8F|nr:dTDP-4-dehydrorhamnose reductase [Galbibacter sp. BG1]QLE02264.1 dTDP-4-dehydrorhamnose reductase [Galbibacter sp. BG1]